MAGQDLHRLDERPDSMVKAAKNVLDKYAPEFKIVSAVNRLPP